MKRILVDGIYLGLQMKGVGRYTANVLREFATFGADDHFLILVDAEKPLPELPQTGAFTYLPIRVHNHYQHGFFTLPEQARNRKADIVLVPYETTLSRFPCPYAVVCHDVPQLILTSQDEGGERRSRLRRGMLHLDQFLIRQSLQRAARVFANSYFVWEWLDTRVNIARERIKYAPCAPGADFAKLSADVDPSAVRTALNCPDGYILVFATGDRRENLETVLRVFDTLAPKTLLNLVIAGTRGEEAKAIHTQVNPFAWRDRVRVLPFLGEKEVQSLAGVYAGASVYLDLSLHEGFGMQVIEAMACGTAVVSSNRGALPEVAGDAAYLVDPEQVQEISDAVLILATDGERRSSLITAGRAQAAKYSWHDTARTILTELKAA